MISTGQHIACGHVSDIGGIRNLGIHSTGLDNPLKERTGYCPRKWDHSDKARVTFKGNNSLRICLDEQVQNHIICFYRHISSAAW